MSPASHLRTFPFRFDAVRRDNINNVDLSLLKSTRLRGDVELQLRAEFINLLNEPLLPCAG